MHSSHDLFRRPKRAQTHWASFENPSAAKGLAAQSNKGGKGSPNRNIRAGESVALLDVAGSGIINRIWLTIANRSPQMLRSVRIDIYWDGVTTPAVSAPLGDFFNIALGRRVPFESELFSDPEGRSFNCFIPMPFRDGARIVLTNESSDTLALLFYDVNVLLDVEHGDDILYFHAHWRRENPNQLGHDYTILPLVQGSGRFLGTNIGVITDPIYGGTWWGEGEVKIWLDGDGEFPTLCGTGTEDYIGSAWEQGVYSHRTQGCTIADKERGHYAFYRHHTVDPVYFYEDCRVVIQTIGSAIETSVQAVMKAGAPVILASITLSNEMVHLLTGEHSVTLGDTSREIGFLNFYRQDDWCSTAYFYLDRPENNLPALMGVEARVHGLN
ncbi:DUF2961 domain-containing protein [bacterium]|nr:MAG: DUF2961 domain-containing protein [bacterium]